MWHGFSDNVYKTPKFGVSEHFNFELGGEHHITDTGGVTFDLNYLSPKTNLGHTDLISVVRMTSLVEVLSDKHKHKQNINQSQGCFKAKIHYTSFPEASP